MVVVAFVCLTDIECSITCCCVLSFSQWLSQTIHKKKPKYAVLSNNCLHYRINDEQICPNVALLLYSSDYSNTCTLYAQLTQHNTIQYKRIHYNTQTSEPLPIQHSLAAYGLNRHAHEITARYSYALCSLDPDSTKCLLHKQISETHFRYALGLFLVNKF